jgi:hypothetical protein
MVFQVINKNFEDALLYSTNLLVDEFDFYQKLRPRMQTELIATIFRGFLHNFEHFFSSLD